MKALQRRLSLTLWLGPDLGRLVKYEHVPQFQSARHAHHPL